jgi:hypothetical protein
MKIYLISHVEFENAKVFTSDKNKISEIIDALTSKTNTTRDKWEYREIEEGKWFTANSRNV